MMYGIRLDGGSMFRGDCMIDMSEAEYEVVYHIIQELFKMGVYNFELDANIVHGKGVSIMTYHQFKYEVGVRLRWRGIYNDEEFLDAMESFGKLDLI